MNFKGAIFDMDGTILDSMKLWEKIDIEFLSKRGYGVPEDYMRSIAHMGAMDTALYTIKRFNLKDTPEALIDTCRRAGIVTEAYSPIAHGMVLQNPLVAEIAACYDVTPAQLCVRYCIELGLLPLPKTSNPSHIANDAEVDFEISKTDMDTLRSAERIKDYGESSFFPVYGGKL